MKTINYTLKIRNLITTVFSLIFILALNSSVLAQVTGTVTVPGTYPTIAAAVADLNLLGVGAGGATVEIGAGIAYTETAPASGYLLGSATLNASLSAANQLIIKRAPTATANPLITANVGTITPAGTSPNSTAVGYGDGIFNIRGV